MTASPSQNPDEIAFEAIHALPGFCSLTRRSPTLDGSLPLRAAQHCGPVFEGNAAGFQISLDQPLTLRRGRAGVRRGAIEIDMTPPAFQQTQREIGPCIERLVTGGLLRRDGYWHRLLGGDALPVRGSRIHLWSGFLVRPSAGACLRVGPAFNRRSRISVVEHAIADTGAFTPLVLEIDGSDIGREPRWITGEIGCVLPVASRASMTLSSVRRAPEVAASVESFFDAQYFETKKTKPTGKYRRTLREQPESEPRPGRPGAPRACDARVFYAGPAIHSVSSLDRFHGPAGVSRRAPDGVALPYCTVRNPGRIEAHWDGQTFTRERKALGKALTLLRRDWTSAGGDAGSDAYEFLGGYFFGPGRDEPYWLLQPWVFCVTPPGWSTVVDGAFVAGCDGMRGIIRTDSFHPVSMVYRMYAPGPLVVPGRAALLRFFPIPRTLQNAGMRVL